MFKVSQLERKKNMNMDHIQIPKKKKLKQGGNINIVIMSVWGK